jgi:hypothetical protein
VESDGEGEGSSVVTAAAAAEVVGFMDWGFLVCFQGWVFSPFFPWSWAGRTGAKRLGCEAERVGVRFLIYFLFVSNLFHLFILVNQQKCTYGWNVLFNWNSLFIISSPLSLYEY